MSSPSLRAALAALLLTPGLPALAQEEDAVLEEIEGSAGDVPEAQAAPVPAGGEEAVAESLRPVTPGDVLSAVNDGAWDTAYELAQSLDPVAVPLITWMRLREGVGTFDEFADFLEDHPHWPNRDRIRRAGEGSILDDSDPGRVRDYFADGAPDTMAGLRAQVRALEALGEDKAAEEALTAGWLTVRADSADQ